MQTTVPEDAKQRHITRGVTSPTNCLSSFELNSTLFKCLAQWADNSMSFDARKARGRRVFAYAYTMLSNKDIITATEGGDDTDIGNEQSEVGRFDFNSRIGSARSPTPYQLCQVLGQYCRYNLLRLLLLFCCRSGLHTLIATIAPHFRSL